jgi:D-aspartate ligase
MQLDLQFHRRLTHLAPALPPALVVSTHAGPFQYGTLAAIRTLGRCGVDVYLLTTTPLHIGRLSRYLKRSFITRGYSPDDTTTLVKELNTLAIRIGRTPVLFCVDDEAAVAVARHHSELAKRFTLANSPPQVVALLASKKSLHDLCLSAGIATPKTYLCISPEQVFQAAHRVKYPFILKNSEPVARLVSAVGSFTSFVESAHQLQALLRQGNFRSDCAGVHSPY